MEIQFQMDGARWRAARNALLLRRFLFVFAVGSAACVALLAIFGDLAHWVVLVAWPVGVLALLFLWRRSRIHPDRYPQGLFTVRASEEALFLTYPQVRACYGWDGVRWARRSGFLVAWVRGAGVICLPPGTFTEAQEQQLRAYQREGDSSPKLPLVEGYDEVAATVDDSRSLQVRGARVYGDAMLGKYRLVLRIAGPALGILGLLTLAALGSGDVRVVGLAVFDIVGVVGILTLPLWGPLASGLRARPGPQFTLHAGPKGIWMHSGRGTAVVDWERTTQILDGRGLTVICIGANVIPVPDDALPAEDRGFAARAQAWRERALQPDEIPRPEGVVAPDRHNPFAPPA